MKKLVALIFTAVLIVCMSSTVLAEGGCSLTASNPVAGVGEKAVIEVKLSENSGIIGMVLQAEYDSGSLELVNVENGKIFKNFYILSESYSKNPYKAIWLTATDDNNTNTGTLIKLIFKVKNTAKVGAATTVRIFSNDCISDAGKNNQVKVKGATATVKVKEKAASNTQSGSSGDASTGTSSKVETNSYPQTVITPSGYNSTLPNTVGSGENSKADDDMDRTTFDPWLLVAIGGGVLVAALIVVLVSVLIVKISDDKDQDKKQ